MDKIKFDCLLAGVGGQGTVLASRILAYSAMARGMSVRTNETIGMAQRGGSVSSHVRIGGALSPVIPAGECDTIIAFEPAEAVRSMKYLKPDGKIVVSSSCVRPVTASLDPSVYDVETTLEFLRKRENCVVVDVAAMCGRLGSSRPVNVVLLGAALVAEAIPFTAAEIKSAIHALLPKKLWELNDRAVDICASGDFELR